jgi:hypothetical protein
MIKIIKQIGGSLGIIIDGEDKKIYDLADGDLVEIKLKKVTKEDIYQNDNN